MSAASSPSTSTRLCFMTLPCRQPRRSVGLLPQSIHGFILRSGGKYTVWKPDTAAAFVRAEAGQRPKARVLAVSETDPRPGLKWLCQLGPLFLAQQSLFGRGSKAVID